jgi:hypothetical protein
MDVLVCQIGQSRFWPKHKVTICSTEPSSAKLHGPIYKTGGSGISRIADKIMTGETVDWRTPLIHYFENRCHVIDTKVRWQALKYVLLDHDLHRRTIDAFLLR